MVADTTADEGVSEVREHIEKVVETLVGANLDQTSVLKLVNHSSCKKWFHALDDDELTSFPSSSFFQMTEFSFCFIVISVMP